jgi:hypothetical protein
MKKTLFVLILLSGYAHGQGLYVKVGGGYAIPTGSQNLFEPIAATSVVGNATIVTTKTTAVKGSYGAGININGAVGYKFSPFIGVDLNISYQIGKEFAGTSTLTTANGTILIDETQQSTGFFVAPALMFMAGTENVRPYAIAGVIMGSMKVTDRLSAETSASRTGTVVYELERESKGEMAFGFRGGMGIDFNINTQFSVYVEGIFNSMSYYAKETNVTKYNLDGQDMLPDLTVSARKTVYVDETTTITVDGTETTDPDQPTEALRSPSPLSSIGINVGLKVKLGSD